LATIHLGLGHHLFWGNKIAGYFASFSWQLRYIGILAVEAAEIAAHCGYRIGKASRQEMKERFLLDWVNVGSHEVSVGESHKPAILILPHAT
jgi:hypothetical protein